MAPSVQLDGKTADQPERSGLGSTGEARCAVEFAYRLQILLARLPMKVPLEAFALLGLGLSACGSPGLAGTWQFDAIAKTASPNGSTESVVSYTIELVPLTPTVVRWKIGGCSLDLLVEGDVGNRVDVRPGSESGRNRPPLRRRQARLEAGGQGLPEVTPTSGLVEPNRQVRHRAEDDRVAPGRSRQETARLEAEQIGARRLVHHLVVALVVLDG